VVGAVAGVAVSNTTSMTAGAGHISPGAAPVEAPTPTTPPTPIAPVNHVGDTLNGSDQSGTTFGITLVQVVDPAPAPANGFEGPDSGNRFVAAQFRITDTDTTGTVQEAVGNDATVFDSQGQGFQPTLVSSGAGPGFPTGEAKVSPGGTVLGWVTFQVPTSSTVSKMTFTPSSGFAHDTGTWTIQSSTSPTTPAVAPPSNGQSLINTAAVPSSPFVGAATTTFSSYFGGINAKNFPQAFSAYSPGYQARMGYQSLASGDATSTDTNVTVTSIGQNNDGSLTVGTTFTSHQSPSSGPNPGETCTNWSLAYHLVPATLGSSLAYQLDSSSPVGSGHSAC
jgi:hypothetical protein